MVNWTEIKDTPNRVAEQLIISSSLSLQECAETVKYVYATGVDHTRSKLTRGPNYFTKKLPTKVSLRVL